MFLVIDYHANDIYYTAFINLTKDDIDSGIKSFVNRYVSLQNATIDKVYFSKEHLSNW